MLIDINRLINSVGTETFIKYYYEFKNIDKEELLKLFKKNNERWNENSMTQKIANAQRIFRENREIEAIEHIINIKKATNIPNGIKIKEKAKEILNDETNKLNSTPNKKHNTVNPSLSFIEEKSFFEHIGIADSERIHSEFLAWFLSSDLINKKDKFSFINDLFCLNETTEILLLLSSN